jgi:hypothetical protein
VVAPIFAAALLALERIRGAERRLELLAEGDTSLTTSSAACRPADTVVCRAVPQLRHSHAAVTEVVASS